VRQRVAEMSEAKPLRSWSMAHLRSGAPLTARERLALGLIKRIRHRAPHLDESVRLGAGELDDLGPFLGLCFHK
jgi:hypothetical protein